MSARATRASSCLSSAAHFALWWLNGTAFAAFIYYFTQFSFPRGLMTPSGWGADIWCVGVVCYIAVLLVR